MIRVNRKKVTPPKVGKNYRNESVLSALEEVFNNKCYLCEGVCQDVHEFEVEHFIPHRGKERLKYMWKNLFLSHSVCNEIKGYKYPRSGYLNPCTDNVEELIVYELEPIDKKPRFAPKNENRKVKNTVTLLNKIHYGNENNSNSKYKTASLRNAISRSANELLDLIIKYQNARLENDTANIHLFEAKIKEILSRKSSYTMLLRSLFYRYDIQLKLD